MQAYATIEPDEALVDEQPDLFVMFTAAGQTFGVPHRHVLEMIQPPVPVPVPRSHAAVEGVINLRGHVIGLVDLRCALGKPTAAQEFVELMEALDKNEQAHVNWLGELERAVREQVPFSLTTDPTACNFGRWLAAFEPPNEFIAGLIARFYDPHGQVHELAHEVLALSEQGDTDQALRTLDDARRGLLPRLRGLFGDARNALTDMRRDVAIILSVEDKPPIAMRVDAVDTIDSLNREESATSSAQSGDPLVCGVATNGADELVLLLDPAQVYEIFAQ